MKYYIVVGEWNYPSESGRDFIGDFDTYEEAVAKAKDVCENEMSNFCDNTGFDCLHPEEMGRSEKGVIITSKMGLDDFYYACRIIEINPLCLR